MFANTNAYWCNDNFGNNGIVLIDPGPDISITIWKHPNEQSFVISSIGVNGSPGTYFLPFKDPMHPGTRLCSQDLYTNVSSTICTISYDQPVFIASDHKDTTNSSLFLFPLRQGFKDGWPSIIRAFIDNRSIPQVEIGSAFGPYVLKLRNSSGKLNQSILSSYRWPVFEVDVFEPISPLVAKATKNMNDTYNSIKTESTRLVPSSSDPERLSDAQVPKGEANKDIVNHFDESNFRLVGSYFDCCNPLKPSTFRNREQIESAYALACVTSSSRGWFVCVGKLVKSETRCLVLIRSREPGFQLSQLRPSSNEQEIISGTMKNLDQKEVRLEAESIENYRKTQIEMLEKERRAGEDALNTVVMVISTPDLDWKALRSKKASERHQRILEKKEKGASGGGLNNKQGKPYIFDEVEDDNIMDDSWGPIPGDDDARDDSGSNVDGDPNELDGVEFDELSPNISIPRVKLSVGDSVGRPFRIRKGMKSIQTNFREREIPVFQVVAAPMKFTTKIDIMSGQPVIVEFQESHSSQTAAANGNLASSMDFHNSNLVEARYESSADGKHNSYDDNLPPQIIAEIITDAVPISSLSEIETYIKEKIQSAVAKVTGTNWIHSHPEIDKIDEIEDLFTSACSFRVPFGSRPSAPPGGRLLVECPWLAGYIPLVIDLTPPPLKFFDLVNSVQKNYKENLTKKKKNAISGKNGEQVAEEIVKEEIHVPSFTPTQATISYKDGCKLPFQVDKSPLSTFCNSLIPLQIISLTGTRLQEAFSAEDDPFSNPFSSTLDALPFPSIVQLGDWVTAGDFTTEGHDKAQKFKSKIHLLLNSVIGIETNELDHIKTMRNRVSDIQNNNLGGGAESEFSEYGIESENGSLLNMDEEIDEDYVNSKVNSAVEEQLNDIIQARQKNPEYEEEQEDGAVPKAEDNDIEGLRKKLEGEARRKIVDELNSRNSTSRKSGNNNSIISKRKSENSTVKRLSNQTRNSQIFAPPPLILPDWREDTPNPAEAMPAEFTLGVMLEKQFEQQGEENIDILMENVRRYARKDFEKIKNNISGAWNISKKAPCVIWENPFGDTVVFTVASDQFKSGEFNLETSTFWKDANNNLLSVFIPDPIEFPAIRYFLFESNIAASTQKSRSKMSSSLMNNNNTIDSIVVERNDPQSSSKIMKSMLLCRTNPIGDIFSFSSSPRSSDDPLVQQVLQKSIIKSRSSGKHHSNAESDADSENSYLFMNQEDTNRRVSLLMDGDGPGAATSPLSGIVRPQFAEWGVYEDSDSEDALNSRSNTGVRPHLPSASKNIGPNLKEKKNSDVNAWWGNDDQVDQTFNGSDEFLGGLDGFGDERSNNGSQLNLKLVQAHARQKRKKKFATDFVYPFAATNVRSQRFLVVPLPKMDKNDKFRRVILLTTEFEKPKVLISSGEGLPLWLRVTSGGWREVLGEKKGDFFVICRAGPSELRRNSALEIGSELPGGVDVVEWADTGEGAWCDWMVDDGQDVIGIEENNMDPGPITSAQYNSGTQMDLNTKTRSFTDYEYAKDPYAAATEEAGVYFRVNGMDDGWWGDEIEDQGEDGWAVDDNQDALIIDQLVDLDGNNNEDADWY